MFNIVHILFFVIVLIGAFVATPIVTEPMIYVQGAFDAIDALPEGSKVFWCMLATEEFDMFSYYCEKMTIPPVIKHLIEKKVKLVTYGGLGPLVNMHDKLMALGVGYDDISEFPGYGTTLVDLGILPGGPGTAQISALSKGFDTLTKEDMFGTPLDEIPLMQEFQSARDADMIIGINWLTGEWRAYTDPATTKYVIMYPAATNILQSSYVVPAGLVDGAIAGLKQAGQYEQLTGYVLGAADLMLAETLVSVFIVAGMILGNALWLYNRYVKGETEEPQLPQEEV
jgi:hypothetical protein